MSGLGLKPAFTRGLGLGLVWGLKLRSRLINAGAGATALRYRIYGLRRVCVLCWHMLALSVTPGRFSSCSCDGPHPSPHTHASAPPPPPYQTIPLGGGGGWERQTPDHTWPRHPDPLWHLCQNPETLNSKPWKKPTVRLGPSQVLARATPWSAS